MRGHRTPAQVTVNKTRKVAHHNGHDIYLDKDCQFSVPKLDKRFSSLRDAQTGIDEAVRQLGRVKMAKLDYTVIDDEGDPRTITGIHVTNGYITVTDGPNKKRGTSYREFYPDTPLVHALLSDKRDIVHRLNRVDDCLKQLEIESNYRSSDLAAAYDELHKDIDQKTKRATTETKVSMYEAWEISPDARRRGRRIRL